MIRSLGDYTGPTPIYDYYGRLVDPNTPATAADCLPFQCGAQPSNMNVRLWCAFWGQARTLSPCTDPNCVPFRPSYCTPPAAAAAPVVAAPAQTTTLAPTAAPVTTGPSAPVTVQTPSGPVQVPAALVPAVSDTTLTPAMVHLPSILDRLDPSQLSQFDYRGISTSFPVWISENYRRSLRPAPVEAPELAGQPIWVWLAILGAIVLLGAHERRRRRRKAAA